jgi:hypothetical protein
MTARNSALFVASNLSAKICVHRQRLEGQVRHRKQVCGVWGGALVEVDAEALRRQKRGLTRERKT